jgi:hypothetical protein
MCGRSPSQGNLPIGCTKIEKLANIRMKFGGIMQTVGNER